MSEKLSRIPESPIHPLAALVTIALDGIFGVVEIFDPFLLIFTSLGVGALGGISITLIQRFLANDGWGAAVAKGLALGIVAGVPYPIAGTAIGAPLLAWSGLHQLLKLPGSGNNQIVDEAAHAPRLGDGR
ncbi:MAG: phosphoribosylaminoimidazole carboxylase [Anaerolineales bacterium]